MPGFLPGINDFARGKVIVDGRAKPGHDGEKRAHEFGALPLVVLTSQS
jgi:hypothetical protein